VSDHFFVDMNGRPVRDADTVVIHRPPKKGVTYLDEGLRGTITLSADGRTLTVDWGRYGRRTETTTKDEPQTLANILVLDRPKKAATGKKARGK
jgi:YD repeat-containing protein